MGKIGATALASRRAEASVPLVVYPTPATGENVTISFGQVTSEPLDLRVVDTIGRLVQHQTMAAGSSQYTLPTHGLRAGLYSVQVLSATSQRTGTLVIP